MTKHLQGPAFVPDRTSGGLHLAAGSPVHQYHPKVQSQKPACLSLSPLAQALLPARTPTQAVRSAVAMVTSKATPRHPGCIHAKELLQRFLLHLTPIAGQRRRAGVGKRGDIFPGHSRISRHSSLPEEAVGHQPSAGEAGLPSRDGLSTRALNPASCSIPSGADLLPPQSPRPELPLRNHQLAWG